MRLAQPLTLAATALLAVIPATALAAESDTPPIETIKGIGGETIRQQRFERPAFDVDLTRLSIAQRKMLRAAYDKLTGVAQTIVIECPTMASGALDPALPCRSAGPGEPDFVSVRFATRIMKLTGGAFPAIPAISIGQARKLQRFARFEVRLPAFPAAEPQAPEGPLVASTEISGLNWAKAPVDYPPRALRAQAEGRMTALCQVQVDLSIACAQESFDPPQNGAAFADTASALFLAGRVDPVLTTGAQSAGARFRFAVNFAIPDK